MRLLWPLWSTPTTLENDIIGSAYLQQACLLRTTRSIPVGPTYSLQQSAKPVLYLVTNEIKSKPPRIIL
jgi:hypothetical protein